MQPIQIRSISISPGRMRVSLQVEEGFRRSSPELAARILQDHPSIALHACKNSTGPRFADVIGSTSTPHVLEHLVIDVQLRDASTPPEKTLAGWTLWEDEASGIAQTEVAFHDDMVAVRALRESVDHLNALLGAFGV